MCLLTECKLTECYQQVQQTRFHSNQQRIFEAGKGNSTRQDMVRVWTETQMQCYIHLKGKKHIQLWDQEKLYKGDVPLSWSFHREQSFCQCPEWQGRGRGQQEGGAWHGHAHPGQAGPSSRAVSLFIRVNKGLIVKKSWVFKEQATLWPRVRAQGTNRGLQWDLADSRQRFVLGSLSSEECSKVSEQRSSLKKAVV